MSDLWFSCVDNNNQEVRIFKPGQKLRFQIKAKQNLDKYKISVLDQNNNPRLNCYGKASNKLSLKWSIPKILRNEHLGIWQIQLKINSEIYNFLICVE